MNVAARFLEENRARLDLDRLGLDDGLSTLVVTPRFRASRHVVVLVAPRGSVRPLLVVKIPRLREDRLGVEREAANLEMLQAARPGGFGTIPRLVALEDCQGRPILVETALAGRPMNPALVRREPDRWIRAVVHWLEELPRATQPQPGWYQRLVEAPLGRFARIVPAGSPDAALAARTLEHLEPLREAELPFVFEHGDLSHPNLLVTERGVPGVLDWELAEPAGLAVNDLFFFLAYVAFSRARAAAVETQLTAFREAFVGSTAWAGEIAAAHARRVGVPEPYLTPLFVACWARYALRLLARLEGDDGVSAAGAGSAGPTRPTESAAWLKGNRYYALWREAVASLEELRWGA